MFESAELGQKVDRDAFADREPGLRVSLLDAQMQLADANFSVIVVVAGVEGSGKGDTVNFLLSWLDARRIETHVLGQPSESERERPEFYRFWHRLPGKGRIAIFFGSWYTRPITQHALGQLGDAGMEDSLRRIVEFERMLDQEGVLLVKLWLHITKKQQKKRFKSLASDPDTAWRVTKMDWRFHKTYERFVDSASLAVRRTSTGPSPWHIVEAWDSRYRHLRTAEFFLTALEARLAAPANQKSNDTPALPVPVPLNVISSLDLTLKVADEAYRTELQPLQFGIARLVRKFPARKRSAVLVFEGSDAAGKGGSIRRLTQGLDARFYQVIRVATPTDEELARPYLWRFWRKLPSHGHLAIFDRSWYGRVLVERLEGLCFPGDWRRAYREINAFEEQLTNSGCMVLKFWLAISKDEQARRFQEREATRFKHYKITPEDWRNRDKWDAYEAAACEMVERTSTEFAPWTLVEAEDKYFARLKILRTVKERFKLGLKKNQ